MIMATFGAGAGGKRLLFSIVFLLALQPSKQLWDGSHLLAD
jgi:hypothetical protein